MTVSEKVVRRLMKQDRLTVKSVRKRKYNSYKGEITPAVPNEIKHDFLKNAGLIRSMSKKGCSPDNSACKGFFGRLKNEMFYCHSWQDASIDKFIKILDDYMHWYAEERIKISLGGISPIQYRRQLGLTV